MNTEEMNRLVIQAQKGDKNAFGEIYKTFGRSVYYTCLKLTGNAYTAEDILQDTFAYAFERLSDLKSPESVSAWLNRIAINKCNAFFKNQYDSVEYDISEISEEDFISEEYALNENKRKIIMEIIDTQLSVLQRQTIILYYYNNLNVSEIAKIMDCPEGTVLSRLKLAREKIKEAVLLYESEEDDRIHTIIPIVFFSKLFAFEESRVVLPSFKNMMLSGSGVGDASVKEGGKAMINSVKNKIIIGVVSAVIVVGGVITAVVVSNKNEENESKKDDNGLSEVNNHKKEDNDSNGELVEEPPFVVNEIGSVITFGSYEQDNDLSNGKEPIEWKVLDIKDGKALLISEYCLDNYQFDVGMAGSTWEDCSLRNWLGTTFINEAFSQKQQTYISEATLKSSHEEVTYTENGEMNVKGSTIETVDKVFVLSIEEYNSYFTYNPDDYEATAAPPTEYAVANGVHESDYFGVKYATNWLRDDHSVGAAVATLRGVHDTYYAQTNSVVAVRPAIWVNIE